MRDQLDLNQSLISLLKKSESVMARIKQSEADLASRITVKEGDEEEQKIEQAY